MKVIAFLAIYFAGGVALFPFLDLMRPVGVLLDHFYSQIFLGSDADVAQRLSLSFIYASLFHLVWSALFSEAAKRWASSVSVRDVCYLAFQCLSLFFISLISLGLVGVTSQHVPRTDFHQYFTFLVICMLLGLWAWSLKDFLVAAFHCTGRRITGTTK
ncbi:hypothetical protein BJN42_16985 [Pseudomonas koreensis]|jgi:ABC-type transport system involved in multi-copper enzyme maturation permease subunit|uniref:Uncharacterized protein n=1 Tax=Pseudomonas iranensis TaxID=2745503 RepID=A0AAU7F2D3_9PSED|nr:hypothetical protein BJN42_16985 [Pseudomonas koreensis]